MARNIALPESWLGRLWLLVSRSGLRYNEIDGEQRAASFAYYAFFSLFPLIVLLVTILGGSLLKDQHQAALQVTELLEQYIPISKPDQTMIVNTINGFLKARGSAGLVAFLTLAWSSLRFFQALVRGINRAWGTKEYAWWHLPLKNLGMVGILTSALVLGSVLPAMLSVVRGFLPLQLTFISGVYNLVAIQAVPLVILWYVLTLFYKYAPQLSVSIREVWFEALLVTGLLRLLQSLFVVYVVHYSNFNVIYGTFAGVMALLLWIYLSGSLIIYGGCLCAVGREMKDASNKRGRKKVAQIR